MRLASYEVTIAAPAEVVWAHLTTAEPDHQRGWAYFLDILHDTLSGRLPWSG